MTKPVDLGLDELVGRAAALAASGGRRMLGIVGAPASGKSTVAEAIVAALGDQAALVPMDGYHLANDELERLGRRDRKGAIDTFDADAYVDVLRRLAAGGSEVTAPRFDRSIEASIADDIRVPADVALVVTEGNYLLVPEAPWGGIRAVLDETWYLEPPDELRIARLVARHEAFGKSPADAEAWATGTDQRNAEFIATTRGRADLVVRVR